MGTLWSELGPVAEDAAAGPRIYADANVPAGLVAYMRTTLGWDVLFVIEHADLRRARDIAPDVPPATTSLFIVGHGTDLNDNSARAAKEQAARIRALGKYAQVVSSYMEEPPWIADWDKASSQSNVVIVPFFIADGLHSYQDIPVLIGIETQPEPAVNQTDIFRRNPYELRGKKLFYASAIGTEPMMAEVILDQVAACVARNQ